MLRGQESNLLRRAYGARAHPERLPAIDVIHMDEINIETYYRSRIANCQKRHFVLHNYRRSKSTNIAGVAQW